MRPRPVDRCSVHLPTAFALLQLAFAAADNAALAAALIRFFRLWAVCPLFAPHLAPACSPGLPVPPGSSSSAFDLALAPFLVLYATVVFLLSYHSQMVLAAVGRFPFEGFRFLL